MSRTLPSPRVGNDPSEKAAGIGPLGKLGRFAYRNRGKTVLAWVAALVLSAGLSMAFGGEFFADYSAPGSDSSKAQQLLEDKFPAQSGDTVDVVVRAEGGADAAKPAVESLLAELGAVSHVASIENPYETPGGISPDGRTLLSHIKLDVVNPVDMPVADSEQMLEIADDATTSDFQVALGGQSVTNAEATEIGSEGLGIGAAALILLVTFGTVVAAGLPIIVAIAGLAVSSMLTGLLINFIDAPDWSTSLATMMGIGIGIDYALLMVTRFREWRAAGLEPEAATTATLDTAGRAVMVAGTTVVISMLGLFAMGLSFMRGAALVTILGVLVVMIASITLFPALLGYFGKRIDRLRLPLRHRTVPHVAVGGHVEPSGAWLCVEPADRAAQVHRRRRRCGHPVGAGRSVPRRTVRFPGRRQQRRGHVHPHGVRPDRRRLRPRRERAAAAGGRGAERRHVGARRAHHVAGGHPRRRFGHAGPAQRSR